MSFIRIYSFAHSNWVYRYDVYKEPDTGQFEVRLVYGMTPKLDLDLDLEDKNPTDHIHPGELKKNFELLALRVQKDNLIRAFGFYRDKNILTNIVFDPATLKIISETSKETPYLNRTAFPKNVVFITDTLLAIKTDKHTVEVIDNNKCRVINTLKFYDHNVQCLATNASGDLMVACTSYHQKPKGFFYSSDQCNEPRQSSELFHESAACREINLPIIHCDDKTPFHVCMLSGGYFALVYFENRCNIHIVDEYGKLAKTLHLKESVELLEAASGGLGVIVYPSTLGANPVIIDRILGICLRDTDPQNYDPASTAITSGIPRTGNTLLTTRWDKLQTNTYQFFKKHAKSTAIFSAGAATACAVIYRQSRKHS